MGHPQPLSTPKAAKIAATLRCGQPVTGADPEPGLRRTGATFLPRCSTRGKACGHSTNHVTTWTSALAQREAVHQGAMRSVEQRLGTWGGPGRNRVTAKRCRGQGAWIRADGAIQIVCDQPLSRLISATNLHC